MLVKESSVGTDKAGSLRSIPSVVTHAVRLCTDNGMQQFYNYLGRYSEKQNGFFYGIFHEGGAQWAKSGGEGVLLQFSDSTNDPMHDFNRLFC